MNWIWMKENIYCSYIIVLLRVRWRYLVIIDNIYLIRYIQGDQLYMAVRFWYLVKSGLSSLTTVYTRGHRTSNFLQGGRPCLSGQVERHTSAKKNKNILLMRSFSYLKMNLIDVIFSSTSSLWTPCLTTFYLLTTSFWPLFVFWTPHLNPIRSIFLFFLWCIIPILSCYIGV